MNNFLLNVYYGINVFLRIVASRYLISMVGERIFLSKLYNMLTSIS